MSRLVNEYVPSSLQSSIKQVNDYKINTVKLSPESSYSAAAGQTIKIKCPTNTLIDMSSFVVVSEVVYESVAGGNAQMPCMEAYIQSLSVLSGGKVLDRIDGYNDLFVEMLNYTGSTPALRQRQITSLGAVAGYAQGAEHMTPQTTGGIAPNGNLSKFGAVTSWLGFIGSLNIPYLDSSTFPNLEIEITLAGNNIIGNSVAGVSDVTYKWQNIYATIDTISFPTYQATLNTILNAQSEQAPNLNYSFDRWVNLQFSKAGGVTSNDLKFSLASSNIRKIFFTSKNNGYDDKDGLGIVDSGQPKYFNYVRDNMTEPYLTVGNSVYPQYGQDLENFGFLELLRALGKHNVTDYDCLVPRKTLYDSGLFLGCINLEHKQAENGMMSGINTNGLSSNIQLRLRHSAVSNAGLYYVFALCSAVLQVNPGRDIQVIH